MHKVDTVARSVGGTIEGSLWANLAAQGHSPTLIARVSDVLAYQVDFFSIQPGDEYRVLYQDLQIDGKSVGLGDIKAVSFTASGKTSDAYLFEHDGLKGYYDAEGRPCKREFLKAPLQYSRISSTFSNGRLHPVLRIVRPHHGVDYAAPSGTPVMSVGNGTVLARGWDARGGGNYVKIRHNTTFSTCYMHLKGIASSVRVGGRIGQGQVLGWVGSTGLSTGPHLDFRFYRNGSPVNPLTVVPPPAPPLPAAILPEYLAMVNQVSGELVAVATNFRPKLTPES
jgi:murein DD-endopeptidase MepM/ murein hydrolase activator NlpD